MYRFVAGLGLQKAPTPAYSLPFAPAHAYIRHAHTHTLPAAPSHKEQASFIDRVFSLIWVVNLGGKLLGSQASSKGRVYRPRLQLVMRLEEDRRKTINRYELDVLRLYEVITRRISEEGEEHAVWGTRTWDKQNKKHKSPSQQGKPRLLDCVLSLIWAIKKTMQHKRQRTGDEYDGRQKSKICTVTSSAWRSIIHRIMILQINLSLFQDGRVKINTLIHLSCSPTYMRWWGGWDLLVLRTWGDEEAEIC
jgi:hypothetical protein